MGKKYLFFFFLFLFLMESSISHTKLIRVAIDNKYIQTYRNTQGKWVLNQGYQNPKKLQELANEYQTTVQAIRSLNEDLTKKYIFVPYGDDYLKELLRQGFGRRIFNIDPRSFLWPVENPDFTSRYGRRFNELHQGLDMAVPIGTPVVAARDGIVKKTGWMGGYGYTIVLHHHQDGKETLYAHLSEILVFENEEIQIGQIIGFSGSTGRSTGPHLHFEVIFQDIKLNPEDFLPESFFRTDVIIKESVDGVIIQETVPNIEGSPSHVQLSL
ncbi:MAG: M23 family metallopeptidase [Leptospiraceae bacterium]|nr:M23 family metallopeptidase [Leptospiraceae bacterium]MDW7975778.1 M23 family metallopeptidase [Leptospiraceae bacterium]